MRASRGMGDILPSKMPKAKTWKGVEQLRKKGGLIKGKK